jgi:hypothetical protein
LLTLLKQKPHEVKLRGVFWLLCGSLADCDRLRRIENILITFSVDSIKYRNSTNQVNT